MYGYVYVTEFLMSSITGGIYKTIKKNAKRINETTTNIICLSSVMLKKKETNYSNI